jgi:hypothetical protein
MTCNVGGVERPIRIVVGIALLGIGAFAGYLISPVLRRRTQS